LGEAKQHRDLKKFNFLENFYLVRIFPLERAEKSDRAGEIYRAEIEFGQNPARIFL